MSASSRLQLKKKKIWNLYIKEQYQPQELIRISKALEKDLNYNIKIINF